MSCENTLGGTRMTPQRQSTSYFAFFLSPGKNLSLHTGGWLDGVQRNHQCPGASRPWGEFAIALGIKEHLILPPYPNLSCSLSLQLLRQSQGKAESGEQDDS